MARPYPSTARSDSVADVARTPCGFCESVTNKITKEHLFGGWMTPILSTGRPALIRHAIRLEGTDPHASWESPSITAKVRIACRPCNSGWMSNLEASVKPVLSPMMEGQRRDLDSDSQTIITAWAIKMAMVMEFVRPRDPRYFTSGERRSIMESALPTSALGAHVWLGAFTGPTETLRSAFSRLSRSADIGAGGAYRMVLVLRQLVLQVFVERGSARHDIYIRPGNWDECLVPIWPPTHHVVWPPPVAISEHSLTLVRDRFMSLGV